jgi:hypothetical protein
LQLPLSSWKGKLLSIWGRLVLINSVMSRIVLYMLSFFLLPKGVLNRLDFFWSIFFWQCDSGNNKYRIVIHRKRIYNFLCSMLILHQLLCVLFTLRGIFMHFPELTY